MMRDAIVVVLLSILFMSILPAPLRAGPFENFFKRVRHAFTEPKGKPSSSRTSHRQLSGANASAPIKTSPSPNESSSPSTRRAVAQKSGKRDLPYGTPVPGKKGFVTSPFAPDSGYIDVRDFPPGTEVKDPYTGRTFLTP